MTDGETLPSSRLPCQLLRWPCWRECCRWRRHRQPSPESPANKNDELANIHILIKHFCFIYCIILSAPYLLLQLNESEREEKQCLRAIVKEPIEKSQQQQRPIRRQRLDVERLKPTKRPDRQICNNPQGMAFCNRSGSKSFHDHKKSSAESVELQW